MYGFRTEGKNNNIGKFMEMFHSIEAKMDALIKALNGNGNPVPNSPEDPVNGVSLKNPATAAEGCKNHSNRTFCGKKEYERIMTRRKMNFPS